MASNPYLSINIGTFDQARQAVKLAAELSINFHCAFLMVILSDRACREVLG